MQQILDIIAEKNKAGIPVYIMPVGLPGCGKSTLINALQEEADIGILGFDAVTEEFQKANNLSYSEAFAQMPYDQKKERFMSRRDSLIENEENIYADATNLSGIVRGTVLNEIPQYFQIGVYFPLSVKDSLERCAKREADTGKHIPPEVIENMARYMNVPEPEEFDMLFEYKNGALRHIPKWDRNKDLDRHAETSAPAPEL